MAVKFSNNAKTTLSSGITSSATSITVADGSVFPSISGTEYFYLTLEAVSNPELREIAKCTARSGNTLTITRGQDNTSAIGFSSDDKCELRLNAAALNDAFITNNTTEILLNQFTGDGSTTSFTLSNSPPENLTTVFITGVYQSKSNYSISGSSLTFSTAPPNGIPIEVMVANNVEISITTLVDDIVTTPKIADGNVTLAKLESAVSSKLNGIEASADVTDTANVVAALSAGTGIGLSAAGEISNTAPDQTVALTGAGATSISGTYPNFTITSTDTNTDTDTDTTYTAGSGLSLTGTEFANTSPDQTVALTGAGATSISGTYPNFTITSTDTNTDTNTTYSAGTGMTLSGTTFNCDIDSPSEVGLGNLSNSGNNLSGSFTATGNITAYSDASLKSNVSTIQDALETVAKLRGVSFTRNDLNNEKQIGFIAQEIETEVPEVVCQLDNGIKTVAYGNVVALLVEAIKELKAEVEELTRSK